jgi:hypothetical protein
MSSERRIRASRANGARSRGPVTAEGKKRSSYNAIRHGLLADCIVLPGESVDDFHALVGQFVGRFQPLDDFEFNMIEEMAAHYWRMRRAWAVETATLRDTIYAQPSDGPADRIAAAMGKLAEEPLLHLLHRYENRLHRMYHRAMRNLLQLRAEIPNLPNEPGPTNEHLEPEPASEEPGPSALIQEQNRPILRADAALDLEVPGQPHVERDGPLDVEGDGPLVCPAGSPPRGTPLDERVPADDGAVQYFVVESNHRFGCKT